MNRVISGYFDDAHRGLQRQASVGPPGLSLPPLRPASGPPTAGGGGGESLGTSWDKAMMSNSLQESKSMGFLDFSREQALQGLQADQYQKALEDSSKLARKVRALQEQLAITSAKKEAFKAQAQRLEREFRKGRDQTDSLQKDLLEAKREAGQLSKEAQDAISMMSEMRKAHIAEVKLLQRGLNSRSGDEKARNRVNEMADLVDKVGRAVVQRDEAIREKTKMQAQLGKAINDLRAASDDVSKYKKQNRLLGESLKEVKRKGQYLPPRPSAEPPEDSDAEFEHELQQFENRFEILEEGPAGLDVLASNLSKDKQNLEKRIKAQQDTIRSLSSTIEDWKRLGAEKDHQIKDLSAKLDRLMRDHALFQEQIVQKQREIALQVAEEKAALEARVSELELQCDNARSAGDGMDKASTRLTRELVKAHEQHTGVPAEKPAGAVAAAPAAAAAGVAAAPGTSKPAASAPSAPAAPARGGQAAVRVAAAEDVVAKTGERLRLEVYRDGAAVELRGREGPGGAEVRIPVDAGVVEELDEADPWNDLFSRTGVDPGPPRRIVISRKLGEREVLLKPKNTPVILTAYRYAARRFFLAGMELTTQRLLSLSVTEATLIPALEAKLKACGDDASLFMTLASSLRVSADGASLSLAA